MNRLIPQTTPLLLFLISALATAQVDIYQSDAYSVEEICAREAAQPGTPDYSQAYKHCLAKNRDKPIDQAGNDTATREPHSNSDNTPDTQDYRDREEDLSHSH